MITEREFKDKITVHFNRRDDGGLRATCEVLRGFYLSGHDASAVYRDVIPAIENIMLKNLGIRVKVFPLRPGVYQMEEAPEPARIPDVQDYVVEKVAA